MDSCLHEPVTTHTDYSESSEKTCRKRNLCLPTTTSQVVFFPLADVR